VRITTGLVAAALAFAVSPVSAQKNHEIKFATIAPGGTPVVIINKLNEELIQKSGGRLKLKIYAGSQGDEGDIVKKMNPRIARLHASGLTGRGLGEILPMIRVLELPFLFKDYGEVDYVLNNLYDRFAREFETRGFVLLGWAEVGFVYIFSKDKIATQRDLKRAKIWAWSGDPLASEMFKALDVSPIPLALPNALTSLQTGLINAVYAHPAGMIMLSWYEKTGYMNLLPVTYATGAVLITKKKFTECEPDLQKTLRDVSRKWLRELMTQTRKDNEDAIEILRKRGIELVPAPTGESLQVFVDAGKRVREKLSGDLYPPELLNRVLALLKEYRSQKHDR